MLRESPPTLDATYSSTENTPPTPPFSPRTDPLDDIYGSAPSSPVLPSQYSPTGDLPGHRTHEILSDLPSRQRALDTEAYREGLSNSKSQYVQEGFDEGYALGANLGQRVGYMLGVLQGFVAALRGHDEARWHDAKALWESAQKELAIERLLGTEWVDEEGIWKWEVKGKEEDPTFREVADQHPVVKSWTAQVTAIALEWSVNLYAIESEGSLAQKR